MALRRVGLIGLVGLLGLFGALLFGAALPQRAAAEKCITCEIEEPGEVVEAQILTIEITGQGAVKSGTKTYCENTGSTSKTCKVELAEGKKVALTAAALGEYVFQNWSDACSGSGSCEVTMSEAKSVKAVFTNPWPTAPIISAPTPNQVFEWTAEQSISVSFSDSDPTVARFSCRVDSLPEVTCSSPWTSPKLGAGEHSATVVAWDGGGNGSGVGHLFKVVINPPAGGEEGGSGGEEPPKEEGGSGSGGGTPGGGGTSGTGTTSTTPPPSVAPAIAAKPVVKSHLLGKSTVLRKLALKGLPTGASVAATCKGKGCPFKRKQVKVVGGVADLSALFAKRQLAAGVLIELKVTAPGMTGETIDVKTRAGKAPKVSTS